jgi:hypothetical protein
VSQVSFIQINSVVLTHVMVTSLFWTPSSSPSRPPFHPLAQVSFILINSVVLINVVVAVLLEKCIVAPDAPAGSVNPHRLEEHSRFLEDPAIETRIVEARLIPAFPVEQGAVRAAHQVSYAKPASAPGLGVGGESRPAAEMVHPDSSEGDDKIDDGRNSVAGGGGGGHGRPGDPPSGSIPEGDVGPAGVVGSHYYDPLKEEVEQLRKQIPMLLMAVQVRSPGAETPSKISWPPYFSTAFVRKRLRLLTRGARVRGHAEFWKGSMVSRQPHTHPRVPYLAPHFTASQSMWESDLPETSTLCL